VKKHNSQSNVFFLSTKQWKLWLDLPSFWLEVGYFFPKKMSCNANWSFGCYIRTVVLSYCLAAKKALAAAGMKDDSSICCAPGGTHQ
jgi:hypothetical protein